MGEAEGALEAEENKVLRAQLELGQMKQEIDRRIAEKEEEFNNTRKNHGRAMESLQASLDTEQRAKAEGLRIKKKLEGEINEFEIALDHANKANNEALKSIKRYQGQYREAESAYEEACRMRQEMSEKASLADRRANALQGEVEEARVDAARLADELRSEQDHTTSLSQGKRALETSLGELENRLADANDAAMRGGRSAMAKLETRIR